MVIAIHNFFISEPLYGGEQMPTSKYIDTASFYWKLDEESGTIIIDSTANKADGYTTGSPAIVDGQWGKARSIKSTTDRIQKRNAVVSNANITIMGWYKINPTTRGTAVYQNYVGGLTSMSANGMALGISTDGYYSLNHYGTTGHTNSKTNVPVVNDWAHLAFTKEGTSYKLFINGVLKLTLTAGHNIGTTFSTSYENASTAFGVVDFLVDEIILWEQTLTDDQVYEIYSGYVISNKHLIKVGSIIKAYINEEWISVGGEPVTPAMFEVLRASNLNFTERMEKDLSAYPMVNVDHLFVNEPGRFFRQSIDLKNTNYITGVKVSHK